MTFASYLPKNFKIFGLEIAFYAICILFGALVALFLASYEARKKGFSWDFFFGIFIIAFPAGIVGARIWYVIAQWQSEFSFDDFAQVFRIWDGGLAIQGGAILGIIAGILIIKFRRKGVSVLQAVDFAVPTILVAQALGRWGNFFNHEVFGMVVNRDAWSFLPNFILNQMVDSLDNPALIDVPLFLVEGTLNLMAYFLMVGLIKPLMGEKYRYGDCVCLYFIFYGLIRAVLEPMRNPEFIMGTTDTQASFVMAVVFVGFGVICLLLNRLLRTFLAKGKNAAGDLK